MLAGWGVTCGLCRPERARARHEAAIAAARGSDGARDLGWLVVLDSLDLGRMGQVIALGDGVTIVTRAGAEVGVASELAVRDDFLSAGHALVYRAPHGRFVLSDRRDPGPSANGTFLNGRRLQPGEQADLGDGDEIRVGATHLVFRGLALPGGRG